MMIIVTVLMGVMNRIHLRVRTCWLDNETLHAIIALSGGVLMVEIMMVV